MFPNTKQVKELKKQEKELKRQEKEQKEEWETLKKKCYPLATRILEIILEEKVPFESAAAERPEEAQRANERIQELFLEEDITFQQRELPFRLAMVPLEYVKGCVIPDLERTYENYLTSMIDVPSYVDMKFSDLDRAIKELQEFRVWREGAKKAGKNENPS